MSSHTRNVRLLKRSAGLTLAVILFLVTVLNVLAYRHAYALTHFTKDGTRTQRPESLTLSQKLQVLVTGPNVPRPGNRRNPMDLGLAYQRHIFEGARGLPVEAWYVPCRDSRGLVLMFSFLNARPEEWKQSVSHFLAEHSSRSSPREDRP